MDTSSGLAARKRLLTMLNDVRQVVLFGRGRVAGRIHVGSVISVTYFNRCGCRYNSAYEGDELIV
jgi:hypothetical protein